jgi:hypothetical protein
MYQHIKAGVQLSVYRHTIPFVCLLFMRFTPFPAKVPVNLLVAPPKYRMILRHPIFDSRFWIVDLSFAHKTKWRAMEIGLETTNGPRQVGVRLRQGAQKRAESPSSRTIPRNMINKIGPALFLGIDSADFEFTSGRTLPPPKISFFRRSAQFVASRANYCNEQKICQRRT